MKNVISLLFATLLCVTSFAQEQKKEDSKSKAVEFSARDGSLLKKEFFELGNIKGIDFRILVLTDILKKEKIVCLRLKTTYYSSASRSSDEYVGTLDPDEIDACIKSLNYIKEDLMQSAAEVYTECEYKTKDGVKIGAYFDEKKKTWHPYIQTKSYTSRSIEFINAESLDALLAKLDEAKQKINELAKQ